MLNKKTILITVETGFFGKVFVHYIFQNYLQMKKIVIFSCDEWKQHQIAGKFSPKEYPVKYLLEDLIG